MLTRDQTIVAGSAGLCLLAFVMASAGQSEQERPAVRPVASTNAELAAHCSQYIQIARAKFGGEWKRRLDPRDTVCAEQVQQAWELDWQPRETVAEPVLQPKVVASAAPPSQIAPTKAESAQRSQTIALAAVTDATATAAKPTMDRDVSSANPGRAAQEDTAPSRTASDYDSRRHVSFEDGDPTGTVADEYGQDDGAFSPSDDEDVERALNDEDDTQAPPYDDEVDEYDDFGDVGAR